MPHDRKTVNERNFVTCQSIYLLKTNGRIKTKNKEFS